MANPDPLNKLYQRMSAEQEQYRKWLLDQPPDEIRQVLGRQEER